MGTESNAKAYLKVVKLNKALKLAEMWVNNMSGSTTDDPSELEFDGRPARLGLGAKVTPNAKVAAPSDPVERKLLKKLGVDHKNRSSKASEKFKPAESNELSDEDNDEPESRTSAFAKKRVVSLTMPLHAKKRCK